MNILIIGAGAVGQYLGGRLSANGNNICFIEKSKEKIDFLNKNKIIVKEKEKTYTSSPVEAYFSFADIPVEKASFDYIFLCVKAYHLKSAVEEIITFATDAKIVVFQNGIGNEEFVLKHFMPSCVISATTTTAVYIDENNIVYTSGKGGIGIAPVAADIQGFELLHNIFKDAGFKIKCYSDYKSLKWSKLLINMIANAVVAILDMPSVEVFDNKNIVKLEIEAFKEAVKVARKLKIKIINLPSFPVNTFVKAIFYTPFFILKPFLRKKIAVSRGDKKPSLHIELLNKSKYTENDYINGAIYHEAVKLGIKTPANKIIYEAMEDIVKNGNWEKYRNKPNALWKLWKEIFS